MNPKKNIEYKQEVPNTSEKYLKTIIAFANGNGGYVIFGIKDGTCSVVGLPKDQIFEIADRVTNSIVDSIQPLVEFEVIYQTIEEKTIIVVQVFPGVRRPYYL